MAAGVSLEGTPPRTSAPLDTNSRNALSHCRRQGAARDLPAPAGSEAVRENLAREKEIGMKRTIFVFTLLAATAARWEHRRASRALTRELQALLRRHDHHARAGACALPSLQPANPDTPNPAQRSRPRKRSQRRSRSFALHPPRSGRRHRQRHRAGGSRRFPRTRAESARGPRRSRWRHCAPGALASRHAWRRSHDSRRLMDRLSTVHSQSGDGFARALSLTSFRTGSPDSHRVRD